MQLIDNTTMHIYAVDKMYNNFKSEKKRIKKAISFSEHVNYTIIVLSILAVL